MGTTVVGAMFSSKKSRMYIGHVGDSRCYRVRDGQIRLLTRDHSLINDYLLAMPDLTDEQKSELPKNVITRALGMQDHVVVDLQCDDPKREDIYILCSDGLSGMIGDDEIRLVVAGAPDIREACRRLIQRANERGGEDNITAVVIKIEEIEDRKGSTSGEHAQAVDGETTGVHGGSGRNGAQGAGGAVSRTLQGTPPPPGGDHDEPSRRSGT